LQAPAIIAEARTSNAKKGRLEPACPKYLIALLTFSGDLYPITRSADLIGVRTILE
jgi:hypothetical protein